MLRRAMPDHCHQRDDPGIARDQQQRPAQPRLPDKIATQRPTQIKLVPRHEDIVQIAGNLTVVQPFDCQIDLTRPFRLRSD